MNHAPLRILTVAAALVLSVSLLTGAAVPVRSLPAASGEETALSGPSLQDPDTLAPTTARSCWTAIWPTAPFGRSSPRRTWSPG